MTATEAAAPGQVTLGQLRARGRLRAVAGLLGPAFVASVAYVDPGTSPPISPPAPGMATSWPG